MILNFNSRFYFYRESVDSLVYKFDENSATPNTSANFRISLIDLNKEFSALDNEFSANNWADMQNEEVRGKFSGKYACYVDFV